MLLAGISPYHPKIGKLLMALLGKTARLNLRVDFSRRNLLRLQYFALFSGTPYAGQGNNCDKDKKSRKP
jgi:hypothetical protein